MSRGFTLVELLVVITIIGILATIGMVNYQNVIKSGRDAKRQADLRTIQSALEQFYLDHGYYPRTRYAVAVFPGQSPPPACPYGDLSWVNTCPLKSVDGSKVYLNEVPRDSNTPQYCYNPMPLFCNNNTTRCTSYELLAKLERLSTPSYNCATFNVGHNFRLTPP